MLCSLRFLALLAAAPLFAQTRITTPKEQFGANIGDDYFLFNYKQLTEYWRKLDAQSDRMVVREIGKTAEGRPHLMAIVTSPANHRLLERYRTISRRLALAEGLTDAQAKALAKEGKAIVWIDGGLHANEVLGAQQLGEMVYQMVSRTDEETMRLLNDVIILFVHANPDGHDLVADWYMRNPVPTERSSAQLPRLYHKYIGHDNNRDFFGSTQVETENINRLLYHEWSPQILYNHHQSGPQGTVVYSPPLRDPYNYNLDPMLILGLQSVGAAMHTRLARENKPGATMRGGASYDGWWNGGIRNTATFHNTIAMLTEMIGNPTPSSVPFIAQRQIPGGDLAFPVPPQVWHFRQSIDYSVSLNRAVLDYASRMREDLLYNIYAMGTASIRRGSQDTWTANPRRIAALAAQTGNGQGATGNGRGGNANDSTVWVRAHAPEFRDPRAYIIPSEQRDFPTATKFINALLETGITIHRATAPFTVNGKQYPANSFVVFTAQAFRPHVMDMFEAQHHPDVFPSQGAPPTAPYDIAGWTLAYQMGVQFDRILETFTGPFQKVTAWNVAPTGGVVRGPIGAGGFMLSRNSNNAMIAVNRIQKAGGDVRTLTQPTSVGGTAYPIGSFYIVPNDSVRNTLTKTATDLGVTFDALITRQAIDAVQLRAPRIGLWDTYGGSMPAGWTRWILEQFEFPFARVFAPELDAGNLNAKYDVLVFVTGAIPGAGGGRSGGRGGRGGGAPAGPPANLAEEYRGHFGSMTADRTLPQIKTFIEGGGTVVAIGTSAMNLATFLQLPVEDHLVENGAPLPNTKFYVPGSVLAARVDTTKSVARGMASMTDFFFDDSPVMKLGTDAAQRGVTPIAWFDSNAPLRSGWAWGQQYLERGVIAAEARVGRGRVLLYTPEILQRAQPHATFKLLFNAVMESGAR